MKKCEASYGLCNSKATHMLKSPIGDLYVCDFHFQEYRQCAEDLDHDWEKIVDD